MPAGTQSSASPSTSVQPIPFSKLVELKKRLDNAIFGYDTLKLASILGLVSGLPTLFVGSPGVAKTTLVRILARQIDIKDNEYFYKLFNPYTREEEVFGTVNVKKLTDEGILERNVEGYLPSAKVIFLDEIFKAPGELRSTLFDAMNEKTVSFGRQRIKLPWLAFYSASNEIEVRDSVDIAFLDRFKIIAFANAPSYTMSSLVSDTPTMQTDVAILSSDLKVADILAEAGFDTNSKLKEDEVRKLQVYVALNYRNNARAQRNLLRDFFAFIGQVIPKLDFGAYNMFYENLSKQPYISLRRSAELVYIAYGLAYLVGDQQVDFIHLGVASIFVVPIAFPVYISYVTNIRKDVIKWLKEYVGKLGGVSSSGKSNVNTIVSLYEEAIYQKKVVDSVYNFIKVLGEKFSDNEFTNKLAKIVAEKYRIGDVKHPILSLSETIAGFTQAVAKDTSIADNMKLVLKGIADRYNVNIGEREKECKSIGAEKGNEFIECVYDKELALIENMLLIFPKLDVNNLDEIVELNTVDAIVQALSDVNAKVEYDAGKVVSTLISINKIGDIKQKLIDLKEKIISMKQNIAGVNESLKIKIDAVDQFIIKPLQWIYGFDAVDQEVYTEIKKVQESLYAILPADSDQKLAETLAIIDEAIKTIDDLDSKIAKGQLDAVDYAINYLTLVLQYKNSAPLAPK